MSSDIISTSLARHWDNWSPERRSHNVWATRKKLDGRCEYRKSQGNLSKCSFSRRCLQDCGAIHSIATALTGKLRVTGKQKSSLAGGSQQVWLSPALIYEGVW